MSNNASRNGFMDLVRAQINIDGGQAHGSFQNGAQNHTNGGQAHGSFQNGAQNHTNGGQAHGSYQNGAQNHTNGGQAHGSFQNGAQNHTNGGQAHGSFLNEAQQIRFNGGQAHACTRLDTIPAEIFAMIAKHLQPLWLYNLSHVNGRLRRMLSFEGGMGNRIWYDSMPSTILSQGEMHQLERELARAALATANSVHLSRDLAVWIKDLKDVFGLNQHGPVNNATQHGVNTTGNANLLSTAQATVQTAPPQIWLVPRPMKRVLAGNYTALFNWRREIMGHIIASSRATDIRFVKCQICLTQNSQMFGFFAVHKWGVIWCPNCFQEYTISYWEIRGILGSDEVCYHPDMLPFRWNNTYYFYRPALNQILYDRSWPSIEASAAMNLRNQLQHQRYVMSGSALEKRRCVVRRMVVGIAQMLWNGVNPFPPPTSTGEEDGVIVFTAPNPHWANPDRFKVFRERFCPTDKLPEMLFPAFRLDRNVLATPAETSACYMDDVVNLRVKQNNMNQSIDNATLLGMAESMLTTLTTTATPTYRRRGMGGCVKPWIKAAKEYHLNRIQLQIDTNQIALMLNVPWPSQDDIQYRNIHALRVRVNLETAQGVFMRPDPSAPYHSNRRARDTGAGLTLSQIATDLRREHVLNVVRFNRIVGVDCDVCPIGPGLYFPRGLDGLLEHMRICHPFKFWNTDDFTVVG